MPRRKTGGWPRPDADCSGISGVLPRSRKQVFGFVKPMSLTTRFLTAHGVRASLPKVAFLACCLCLPFKPAFACTSLNADLGISICAADTSWELREAEGDSYVFYNTPEDFAARVVFYDGGTDDGLDSARAARLIAESDGKETDDFAILKMGQVASGNVIYAARASREGVSFVYVNTISVGPSKTMRLSTWRRGDAMSDRDREVHISFGRLLKSDR